MDELLDNITPKSMKLLRFVWWVALLWGILFAIGYVFRLMHWPLGNILKIVSAGGFMAYSLSFLVLSKPLSIAVKICSGISALWVGYIFWGEYFNNGYPLNLSGIMAQGVVFAILFVLHFGILLLVKRARQKKH